MLVWETQIVFIMGIFVNNPYHGIPLFTLPGNSETTAFTFNLFDRFTRTKSEGYVNNTEVVESQQTKKPTHHQ